MYFAKITSVKLSPKAFKERNIDSIAADVDYIESVSKWYKDTVVFAETSEELEITLEKSTILGTRKVFPPKESVGHIVVEFLTSGSTGSGVVEFGQVKQSLTIS